MDQEILLPHNWDPRVYQMPAWTALESGCKRGALCWHRRAGKDSFSLNWTAAQTMQRTGTYWHMAPTQRHVRKMVWDYIDIEGRRAIDQAFPPALRSNIRHDEMKIELKGGSIWQCVGSDNYDALVGANPIGLVFSEWALCDPQAWDFLRPILRENGGWAIFIFTPRGHNHAEKILQMAEKLMREDGSWFAQTLTVEDTGRLSSADIEEERRSGMVEEMIQQEYYCSFEAPNTGAYYGKQMAAAKKEGRIGRVPVEPGIPCETWWDLGMDDSMSIWITQTVVREIRFVHFYENSGEGLSHYATYLHNWAKDRAVTFSRHGMPHDIEVRELGTGKSRREICETRLGIRPVSVAPQLDLETGIENVRRILPQCWFDETECARGIAALTEYTKEWDDKHKVFAPRPLHNWASHGSDAFRTLANLHPGKGKLNKEPVRDRYADRGSRPQGTWMSR